MADAAALRPDPYCGPAPWPETLLVTWNLDLVLIAVMGALAAAGGWRLRIAGDLRRKRAFGVAWGVAVVAFVSPLCALTVALFAARGLHHLLVVFALAPALAVAFPLRTGAGAPAFLALSAALWAWHVPAVYALAWDHAAVY